MATVEQRDPDAPGPDARPVSPPTEPVGGAADVVPADREPAPLQPAPGVPVAPKRDRKAQIESLLIFAGFWLAYGLIGYRVVIDQHVVVFDALDRLTRAYLVWHNDPPKLASVGFGVPPMTSFILTPFTLVKPFATSLIALPVASGLFAAGTLVVLNKIMRSLELAALLRLPLLILFAANPMFVFYATNGMSEAFYLFLLAAGLYSFIEWYLSEEARHLIGAGLAFSVALLTRYQFFAWAALMAFMVAAALKRRKAGGAEIEGSTLAYIAPVIYVVTLWTLFNLLILGDPFGWIGGGEDTVAANAAAGAGAGEVTVSEALSGLFEINFGLFPLSFVAGAALLLAFVIQRNDMALWLALFVVLGIALPAVNALIAQDQSVLELRATMPVGLTALVGAVWLMFTLGGARIVVWVATLIVLAISLVTAWGTMQDYRYQRLEQAFVRAIETGDDQEGTSAIGGFNVGVRPEQQMAAFINRNVKGRNQVLTDNGQTFGVIMLSGRPEVFFDRIDRGDSRWRTTVLAPYGRVRYILVAADNAGDQIRRAYPSIDTTGVPGLSQAYKTGRYLLLRVSPTDPRAGQRRGGRGGRGGGSGSGSGGGAVPSGSGGSSGGAGGGGAGAPAAPSAQPAQGNSAPSGTSAQTPPADINGVGGGSSTGGAAGGGTSTTGDATASGSGSGSGSGGTTP